MTNHKNGPGQSDREFKMTAKEAALSFAALFYFQTHMQDDALKLGFERELLSELTSHSARGLKRARELEDIVKTRAKEDPKKGACKKIARTSIGPTTLYNNYVAHSKECREAWVLTVAAKLICLENKGEANAYKPYFAAYAPYMFSSAEKAEFFEQKKPKIVTIDDHFSFSGFFKPKSETEKLLKELADNVNDFLADDPFADAINLGENKKCLKNLQARLVEFSENAEPYLRAIWKKQGLGMPDLQPVQPALAG